MKSQKKLIVIMTVIALLICAAMTCALADERIYTSPAFKLPADKITEWVESQPEETEPEDVKPEEGIPDDETEPDETEPDETEPDETEPAAEGKEPERKVTIFSSQGDVVMEGEIIYLTSKLEGFDGLDIAYQWQVDRGDGAGWVDVEGANRPKHMFVASRETIQYSWRLVVNVIE